MITKAITLRLCSVAGALALACALFSCSQKRETAAKPLDISEAANLVQKTNSKSENTSPQIHNQSISVSGTVLNVGYLADTQVCYDINDNGECDSGEPSTISDTQGQYYLSVPSGHRGASLLAIVNSDSIDSAHTVEAPISFTYGWVLPTLLEYEDGAETVEQNITLISMVNHARQRVRGRSRESNKINTFRRVVGAPNIDPEQPEMILGVDFDYVSNTRNNLSQRLYDFQGFLKQQSQEQSTPLPSLDVTAYGYALYNSYKNASDTEPTQSANVAALISNMEDGEDIVATFREEDHRYFRSNTDAITQLRIGLTETTGWDRRNNSGNLSSIGRRSMYLKNGKSVLTFEQWHDNIWQTITVSEAPSFTLKSSGELVVVDSTDSQQPRAINAVDGNRVSMRMPGNNARVAYDFSNSPGTNFFIEEWVDEQQSINWYYPEETPEYEPFMERPECAKNYPNYRHQPNTTRDGLSNWYTQCFDYYTAEYYSEVLGDLELSYEDPDMPGATFYDITLLDPILVLPASTNCGNNEPIQKLTTKNIEHCNWAMDSKGGHKVDELFNNAGFVIHSWNNVYGKSDFESDDGPIISGTPEQVGQPQQLTLALTRQGSATTGTGTIHSAYGAWTASSYSPVTEKIVWTQSPNIPNLILVEFPFRDINNPLVPEGIQSDGVTSAEAPAVLSGARLEDRSRSTHFTTIWNNSTFRMDQSTHTSINREKIAIYLTDEGHIMVGQYFDRGYTFSERYFNTQAFDEGLKALQYVLNKLFNVGWTDKVPAPEPAAGLDSEPNTET